MKTIDIHGKPYVEVKERVMEFHKLYPNGKITTKVLQVTDGKAYIQATVTPDVTVPERFFTGTAYEVEGSSNINNNSFVENCETSSVGRALGFLGLGIDGGIASAEEMMRQSEPLEEEQVKKICEYINGFKNFDMDKFLKFARVDAVEHLLKRDYGKIVAVLEKKQAEEKADDSKES